MYETRNRAHGKARMTSNQTPLEVKLWGDYACFTRPEMKVERVSYPVMTPSAARGILEAIFWKPEMTWSVDEIQILRPIRYASIVRNEITSRQSERTATNWSKDGGGFDASNPKNRAQRHTLALRDVAYVIKATPILGETTQDDVAKYRDQFRRRVTQGRCFATPYLGCREFSAYFSEPEPEDRPIDRTEDLGLMLLEIEYHESGNGQGKPRFFDARLESGVLRVPKNSQEAR